MKISMPFSSFIRKANPLSLIRNEGFWLVFLCLGTTSYANPQIDSLITVVSAAPEDSNKVLLLNELSRKYIFTLPAKSLEYAHQAESLSTVLNYRRGKALSVNSIGTAHWSLGDLEKGLTSFIHSKNLAKEIGNRYLVAKNTGNMGIIYSAAGNYQSAIGHYKESLALFEELNHQERIAVTYNNLGKSYLELADYDSAKYFLKLSESIAKEVKPSLLSIVSFNQADLLFRQQKYQQAIHFLTKSESFALQYHDKRALIRSKQMLAEIKLKQNLPDVAIPLAREAYQLASSTSIKELQYLTAKTISKAMASQGMPDSAYAYLLLSEAYRDSLHNKSDQEKLSFLEYEQQRREINLLTYEKELEQSLSKEQKAQIYLLYVLLFLAISLIVVLFRSHFLKRKANQTLKQRNELIRKQKEDMALQAQQLQELNKTKDKILSIISHDLKSPLNSIAGSLNLLEEGLISQEEFGVFVPELSKKVSYTTSLLDNLLHWARNQLEGTKINPEKINLRQIAINKTELLKGQAEQKQIKLKVDIPRMMEVVADDIMIQIVMQNLISNAIKFCKRGDVIIIWAQPQEDQAMICVEDTGRGIAQEDLEKIFGGNSFSTRGTANEKGTGLGLSLCRDFIEKNGGRIWVESTLGQGSKFFFTLPLCQMEPQLH